MTRALPMLLAALCCATAVSAGERMVVTPLVPPPAPSARTLELVTNGGAVAADVVARMDAAYAFGASSVRTVLKRTAGGGWRVETVAAQADGVSGRAPKARHCAYDVPQASGRRVVEALLAVMRKARAPATADEPPLGRRYAFFARDRAETLRARIDNPPEDSEPGMIAAVMEGFEEACPDPLYASGRNRDAVLDLLEKRLGEERGK
ncbi:MAG: hypothetical protein JOZ72_00165 [Alphaproteobacteria bacterium]|nr:hypothetical protein [Alphaproteobacteria bacterium]